MSNEDVDDFAKNIESEVFSNIKRDILKRTKEIYSLAVDLFKKRFWYEKENEQRNWNKLDDEEIDLLFKKFRAEYYDMFDIFKNFKVLRYPLRCIIKLK